MGSVRIQSVIIINGVLRMQGGAETVQTWIGDRTGWKAGIGIGVVWAFDLRILVSQIGFSLSQGVLNGSIDV